MREGGQAQHLGKQQHQDPEEQHLVTESSVMEAEKRELRKRESGPNTAPETLLDWTTRAPRGPGGGSDGVGARRREGQWGSRTRKRRLLGTEEVPLPLPHS